MIRPMSEVLYVIYCRAEMCSSLLQALDQCLQYKDITHAEHLMGDRMIMQFLNEQKEPMLSWQSRKIAFKHFIEKVKQNERYCIH